ncbi:uncharacterized protein ACRADG_003403 isoform 1-T2 [Cochliomyia hominivorax]
MMHVKVAFALLAMAVVCAQAKPSHPFGLHGVPAHLDLVPPVLPPAHFHSALPAPLLPHHHHAKWLPASHFHALPAPAPIVPAPAPLLPAPAPLLPAPAPLLPAPAPLLPAPAPLLPAPAPLLPAVAPVVPAHAHVVSAATPILPPVLEAVPFVEHVPTYRAIPGPKTTTHHVSVGYAFPRLAKLHAVSHAHHIHAAPLTLAHHHHHHSLF